MQQTIAFLESMGKSPRMSAADYAAVVKTLDIDHEQRKALLSSDGEGLNELLGGRPEMVCLVWQPEQEPLRRDDERKETDLPEEEAPPAKE